MDLRGDLLKEVEVFPIVGAKPAQRENAPETAAAQKHQQCRSQRPTGNGVAEEDHEAADEVELRSVFDGFPHAKWNADQVTEHKSG